MKEHSLFNGKKAVIYLLNVRVENMESFQQGLREVYAIKDVQRATWIRTNKHECSAYLLQFATDELPEYIKITGEVLLTKAYPYKEKPLVCKRCQDYGHTVAHCTADQPIYGYYAGNLLT